METDSTFFIVIGTLFILVALAIALFSLLTLITIIACWHTHCRSISNFLVCNSCVANVFFDIAICIQIPSLFQVDYLERYDFPAIPCRIRAFLLVFACVAKVCSYLIQAIARYFITVLYKRKNLLTYRTNGSLILASWISSFVLTAGLFISPVAFQYEVESRLCVMTSKVFRTAFTLMVLGFVIPVNIIIILYVNILWRTVRTNQIQPNAVSTRNNNKRNIKVFKNILMLLVIVLVGGSPFLCAVILNRMTPIPWPLYALSIFSIVVSTATESFVLFFTNKEVKRIVYERIGIHQAIDDDTLAVAPRTGAWTLQNHIHTTSTMQVMQF